jgi:hypothetical protein
MSQLDLTNYPEVDPSWCKRQRFVPNRFFKRGDEVYLVVQRSPKYGDFALNKASLDYLTSRPLTGFVVLIESDMTPVTVVPVTELATRLANHSLRDGKLGEYWWLDEKGNPSGSAGNSGYCEPF